MRLQVYLSRNGVCSRRRAMVVIQQGRVKVNGTVVEEPSFSVSAGDVVNVNDREVKEKKYTYIMLNKPEGYVTTKADRFAKRTVLDLLPQQFRHLVPVGRLDKDTEGLLLLTNDGDLTYQLTHPKFEVDKTYFVRVTGRLEARHQKTIAGGMVIDREKTSPARLEHVRFLKDHTEFDLTIHEGKKRQVRRMLATVGYRVVYLQRLSQGPLMLGDLKVGHWRELDAEEIKRLRVKKT